MSAQQSTRQQVGSVVGMVMGTVFSSYVGTNALIPLVGIVAVTLAGRKLTGPVKDFWGAIAIQSGHLAWMAAAGLMVGWWPLIVDLVIMGGGLLWLGFRPGLWPVVALSLWQVWALFVNVSAALQADSVALKALTVHILLRVLALVAMFFGMRLRRREHPITPVQIA